MKGVIVIRNNKNTRKSGFTLVELMAVLMIVGLLAGIAVKSFSGTADKAAVKTTIASIRVEAKPIETTNPTSPLTSRCNPIP